MKKSATLLLMIVLLSLPLASLTACRRALPEFRIGMILPLTGEMAPLGQSARNAAELAAQEINQRGGLPLNGQRYQIVLVVEDDASQPESAVAAAQKLINQENIDALIGPLLDRTAVPVARVAENAGILMITPTSTDPETTLGRDYVFRTTYTNDFQGEIMARFTFENLSSQTLARAAVLYNIADPYSVGIAEIFRQVYESAGGNLVLYESYTTGETDFSAQFERMLEAGLEVIILPNFPHEVSQQVAQARSMGIYQTIISGDALSELVPNQYPELSRLFLTASWHPDVAGAASQRFVAAYTEAYGQQPTSAAALTYDTMQVLLSAAIAEGTLDAAALRAGMVSQGRYEGVTGIIEYRAGSGDPNKSVVVVQLLGERFAYIDIFAP